MSKKYKDKCLLLVIFTDKNKKDIEQACKNVRQKNWFFAINENLHLTKEFNNPHVPAYFVLDASSKIAQTPAPEPKNFEP